MGRLDEKVAIITGAGGGMGLAQVEFFIKEGAKVVGIDRNTGALNDLLAANPNDLIAIQADIASGGHWKKVVQTAVEKFGKLTTLANSAGIVGPAESSVVAHDLGELDTILNVNLKGPFIGMKYAIPEMIKAGGGSVVNVSSIGGVIGDQGGTGYGASKAAVIGMSRNVAVEYGPDNVRVNTILPGQIITPMSAFLESEEAKDIKQVYIDKTPLGHFGDPDDIAYATVFLASDESKFITGTELYVDGGVTAK